MSETSPPFADDVEQTAGQLVVLSPLVRRIVAPNPGPMTFKGTCTYIVGHDDVAVIDPGPADEGHIETILAALGKEKVGRILVTHTHRDHSPGARLLHERTGAPVFGCARYTAARKPNDDERPAVVASNDLDYAPDHILAEGETVSGPGFTLEAIATPGHTMNHLAFALEQESALFSGDHVMGWSTTIVAPPTGSMTAYMESLRKLLNRRDSIYLPGHGNPIHEPRRFVRALQHHRRQRETAILACLRNGTGTADTMRAAIYSDLDSRLARAATLSVLAHLEDLEGRGRLERIGPPGKAARFALKN